MNLPKLSSFKRLLKVYTLRKILLWIRHSYFSLENACDSWCMPQTALFSSASVVPQSKFTSCEGLRPLCHKVNVPSCVARRLLFHKVNLPRCEARRRHFIMNCDISFRHWTNEHFSSMLFIRRNVTSPQ